MRKLKARRELSKPIHCSLRNKRKQYLFFKLETSSRKGKLDTFQNRLSMAQITIRLALSSPTIWQNSLRLFSRTADDPQTRAERRTSAAHRAHAQAYLGVRLPSRNPAPQLPDNPAPGQARLLDPTGEFPPASSLRATAQCTAQPHSTSALGCNIFKPTKPNDIIRPQPTVHCR